MLHDDMPMFNLRAVVQETGVKPDTLRAWERRYGLPQPDRTEGGHRLYSRRDIKTIKWLLAQREAGMGISKAAELWRQLEFDSEQSPQSAPAMVSVTASGGEDTDNIAALRQSWISASMAFDEGGARQALAEAFVLFSVERVCFDVLLVGLAEIGRGWYEGHVTVQQEHFATSLATRQLESLITAAPAPTRSGRILVACPPQENHVFALLLLTLLLRRRGWDVVYLGANVPIDHITDTVRNGDFHLVVSSAQQLHTAASLMEMAAELHKVGAPVVYGGRIFNILPALRSRIPGTFLGERLDSAPQVVENVMVARPAPIPPVPASEQLLAARDHFQQHLPAIEGAVEEMLAESGITHAQLYRANRSMDMDISSALILGDMSYLGNEVTWVEGLMRNHEVPAELLDRYLIAYKEALNRHLNGRGEPILDWLGQLA